MPTTPAELMECAASFAKNTGGVEAATRAAISRAYYAAYHDCKSWYEKLPAPGRLPAGFGGAGVHVEFAELLKNPDPSLSPELQQASKHRGQYLRKLHGDRVTADYKLNRKIHSIEARNAVAEARAIAGVA